MIQFNLLPDVKLNYIKSQRQKRIVMFFSLIGSAAALAIMILMFVVVNVFQKTHLNNLNKDVAKYSKQLQSIEDLDKILTIQSQLNSLPDLHNNKVVSSRLAKYAAQITPVQASIAQLNIDFNTMTITIAGGADTLGTVNKFADTLKFTTFKTADETISGNAFSNVVLSTFGVSEGKASYELQMTFEPAIFTNASDVTLTVPNIISTRSQTEKPEALFQPAPVIEGAQ